MQVCFNLCKRQMESNFANLFDPFTDTLPYKAPYNQCFLPNHFLNLKLFVLLNLFFNAVTKSLK